MFAAFALAIIAVGIAITAWFHPIPSHTNASPTSAAPAFTDQQIAAAKAHVCATYSTVHRAVGINTERSGGDDPIAILAVAANARLALYGGGGYLLDKLAQEAATLPDLRDAIRTLANAYRDIAIGYMVDKQNSDLEQKIRIADTASVTVESICK